MTFCITGFENVDFILDMTISKQRLETTDLDSALVLNSKKLLLGQSALSGDLKMVYVREEIYHMRFFSGVKDIQQYILQGHITGVSLRFFHTLS